MSDPHQPDLCETCQFPDYESFRHTCVHESTDKNELWLDRFSIKTWPSWVYSLDQATLTFSHNGSPRVLCNIQVAGTVQDDTWQWSWSNNSLPPKCCQHLAKVKAFGRQKGWMKLSAPFLNSDEYLGWDCVAIASHILQAESVYRCPTDAGFVYFVILSTHFIT